jgi:hypothetical protein
MRWDLIRIISPAARFSRHKEDYDGTAGISTDRSPLPTYAGRVSGRKWQKAAFFALQDFCRQKGRKYEKKKFAEGTTIGRITKSIP